VRRALLLAVLTPVLALAATAPVGAFTAADACDNLQSCTLVTGPWVVVPAATSNQYGEGAWFAQCPELLLAADVSYTGTGTVFAVTTIADPPLQQLPIYRVFYGFNGFSAAYSFQPGAGCTPYQFTGSTSSARAAGLVAVRQFSTREVAVRPSRTLNLTNRCSGGKRLTSEGAAVAFKTRRRPTRQEMNEVRLTHTRTRTGGRIRVTVGPHVGDHETVVVQLHKRCV
jgi:hypothetical protein